MTVGVETCSTATPVITLAQAFLDKSIDEIVVLEEGNAVGVVGQADILRAYLREDFQSLKAEDILREGVPQVPADIPLAAAAEIMLDLGVRTLFLMHHSGGIEYPAASISYRHYLRHITAKDPQDLRDLGISAERHSPLETFIQRRDEARKTRLRSD
jgi:CBS domain-containing protein